MRMRLFTSLLALVVLLGPSTTIAEQGGGGGEAFERAHERFRQGLVLAQEGFCEPALEHFDASMRLYPTSVALFNICRCQALLEAHATAFRSFERYLAEYDAELEEERRLEVRGELARLESLVARLQIDVEEPAGATVLLDNAEVGDLPLPAPLVVNAGEHTIVVRAEGYLTARRTIRLEGGARRDLLFSLRPEDQAGTIVVESRLSDVEISLDGERLGSTPLEGAVIIGAGPHRIEASRQGYESSTVEVSVDVGETTRVELELLPLRDLPPAESGHVVVETTEDGVELLLDGRPWERGEPVPRGRHLVSVRLDGFEDWSGEVEVEPGETSALSVTLQPTAAFVERYQNRARSFRLGGWISGGLAVALLGTTLGLYIWNEGRSTDRQERLDALDPTSPDYSREVAELNDLGDSIDSMGAAEWALLGVGVAALGVSLGLLIGGPRPGRYVSVLPGIGSLLVRVELP